MNVNWIKGEIDPPDNGEYYVIYELNKAVYPIEYIEIDTDYYDCECKEWRILGKNNVYYTVIAWARVLRPNIPENLLGKVNCYFGVELK